MEGRVRLEPDGTCTLLDGCVNVEASWPSLDAWAAEWHADSKVGRVGPAFDFASGMTEEPSPWAVDALVHLANYALGNDAALSMVGAGPIEDLVSHNHHGALMLQAVDTAARQEPAFRKALSSVWLSDDVPDHVRRRLAQLGARDFVAENAMNEADFKNYEAERDRRGLSWG